MGDMEDEMEIEETSKNKKIKKKKKSPEIVKFKLKLLKVLRDSGFGEKRSSKLHWSDFLVLLETMNSNDIYF